MWTFNHCNGRLYGPDGSHVASGYAGGNEGKNPEGINNHSMQDQKGIGPLPTGFYIFGDPVPQSKLGPFAIPLIPDSSNTMYGRGDFYCHGDTLAMNHSASEGCIIMPRQVREEIWNSGDRQLAVIYIRNGEE